MTCVRMYSYYMLPMHKSVPVAGHAPIYFLLSVLAVQVAYSGFIRAF